MSGPFQICDSVYMIGSADISDPMDCCVYMVDAGELVMIDAGAGKSTGRLIDNILTLGFMPEKLSAIIVTHAHIDHIGSLASIKEKYEVKIIAHEKDKSAIETGRGVGAEYYGVQYKPCVVDIILKEEEEILSIGDCEFTCLHVPGHTPGSMVATMQSGNYKVLFGQDIHGPYHSMWGGDPFLAMNSLEIIRDIKADILCEGHYGIIKPSSAINGFIQDFINVLKR